MSVIKNAEKNKSSVMRQFYKARKNLQAFRSALLFKRYLKYDEDKKRIDKIRKKAAGIDKIMSELSHILVHDKYWAKMRQ